MGGRVINSRFCLYFPVDSDGTPFCRLTVPWASVSSKPFKTDPPSCHLGVVRGWIPAHSALGVTLHFLIYWIQTKRWVRAVCPGVLVSLCSLSWEYSSFSSSVLLPRVRLGSLFLWKYPNCFDVHLRRNFFVLITSFLSHRCLSTLNSCPQLEN